MKHLFIILLLISSIFSQQTIAVLDFEGIGGSQEEARALSNRFGSEFLELAGYKYTLVERQAMGEILKEQGLQQSGCVSSECAVEVGAALGAQLIIIGSISKVGTIFSVNARMLDVETSRILKSINYDQMGNIGLLLTKGMREAAAKLLNVVVKPAAPSIGTVSFTSEYQGVDIFVNEEQIGSVPLLKNYTVGVYEFSASKLNYETYEGEFEIRTNDTTEVFIKLKPKVTSLTINSNKGVVVYLNDENYGMINQNSLTIDSVTAGSHVIKGMLKGYYENEKTVNVFNMDQDYIVDLSMSKVMINVDFNNYRPNQELNIQHEDEKTIVDYKLSKLHSFLYPEGVLEITITEHGLHEIVDNINVTANTDYPKQSVSYRQSYNIPNPIPIEVPVTFKLNPTYTKVAISKTKDLVTPWSYSDIIFEHEKPQNLIFGDYGFKVTAPKYQSKKVSVFVNEPESQKIQIDLEPKKRIRALTYSSLLPGSGQFYAENKTKSAIFFLASAGLSAMLYNNYDTYNVEEPLVSQYKENYLNALDPDEIDQTLNTYQSQVNTVNDLQTQMMIYGGALAVTWIANIIDAYFFSGLLE